VAKSKSEYLITHAFSSTNFIKFNANSNTNSNSE